ncbi:MAG: DNA-binding protein [Pseudonocardiaceae bacterium]
MQPLTFDQLHALPTVVNLMTAARALGIGRTKAYQLAHTGQFPVRIIRVGTNYHIPTTDLLTVLGVTLVPPPRTSTETKTPEQEHTTVEL